MTPRLQKTIAQPVEFQGRGLFHGIEASVRILPAADHTGIVFRRTDVADTPDIPARVENVTRVPRRTVLEVVRGVQVETVEHIMAALAGLQIDNAVIEIDAPEFPASDGSCIEFCERLLEVEHQTLTAPVNTVRVATSTQVESPDGGQSLTVRPYIQDISAFTYHLNYGVRSPVPPQAMSIEVTPAAFVREIAAARTFVLESEIRALKSMGYGQHLTARDLVVVGPNGVIDNELRWQNEAVRHKILDCIGDLALSGLALCGHVTACRSGHHLNHVLAKRLNEMAVATEKAASAATAASGLPQSQAA